MATSNRIQPDQDFELTGKLDFKNGGWEYRANVTRPVNNSFSDFVLNTMKGMYM